MKKREFSFENFLIWLKIKLQIKSIFLLKIFMKTFYFIKNYILSLVYHLGDSEEHG